LRWAPEGASERKERTIERHGSFTWRYLGEGPEVWRVEIGKK
jgi:uncharacterized protein (DUF2249 family)